MYIDGYAGVRFGVAFHTDPPKGERHRRNALQPPSKLEGFLSIQRRMTPERPIYPLSALVGQERLKRALTLNAINPRIGGVLIRGEKGTAKSTAVRGLARLLPSIDVVADCPYSCPPGPPGLMGAP